MGVDVDARTADVLGMTTYEHLVDAVLPYGLMPLVVPELKTITLGGAVTGLGIESSSFRNGCPHESVLELDVLTGDGRVVTARPEGEHADLFAGFPNSYGTLGYALRLRIELEPVRPYVMLTHTRYRDAEALAGAMAAAVETRRHGDVDVDFLDGAVLSAEEMYLTVGTWADEVPYTSDYTGNHIYYRSIQQRARDFLTVRDYLWRWDTDSFWCSRAMYAQRPWLRPLLPKRLLRSDNYWRVVAFERRHGWKAALDRRLGRPGAGGGASRTSRCPSLASPSSSTSSSVSSASLRSGCCPLRQRDPARTWDLYALDPTTTYANVGFWSATALPVGAPDGHHNRRIEQVVAELGGRKSLYSTSFSPSGVLGDLRRTTYDLLKKSYDADGRLLDLYEKTVRQEVTTMRLAEVLENALGGASAVGIQGLRRLGGRTQGSSGCGRGALAAGDALRRRLARRPRAWRRAYVTGALEVHGPLFEVLLELDNAYAGQPAPRPEARHLQGGRGPRRAPEAAAARRGAPRAQRAATLPTPRRRGDQPPLRRVQPVLLVVARVLDGLHVRLLPS